MIKISNQTLRSGILRNSGTQKHNAFEVGWNLQIDNKKVKKVWFGDSSGFIDIDSLSLNESEMLQKTDPKM